MQDLPHPSVLKLWEKRVSSTRRRVADRKDYDKGREPPLPAIMELLRLDLPSLHLHLQKWTESMEQLFFGIGQ